MGVLNGACPGCFPPGVSFEFFYRKSDEYTATWREGVKTPFILTLVIGLGVVTLLIIGSIVIHYVLKRRAQRVVAQGNEARAQVQGRFMNSTQFADQSTAMSGLNQSELLNASHNGAQRERLQTVNLMPQQPEQPVAKGAEIVGQLSLQSSYAALTSEANYKYDGKEAKELMVLDGIRALACVWILCLSDCIRAGLSATVNPWINVDNLTKMPFTILSSSHLCFDEFFMLAAFLTTIKMIPYIRNSEKPQDASEGEGDQRRSITESKPFGVKSIPQLFLYRVGRLAPLYYSVFMIGFAIMPFVGGGPIWWTFEKNFQQCEEYWWSVFTFTINFFPDNQLDIAGCYYWGWFVACEIQIFLLLPLYIWMLTKCNTPLFYTALLTTFVGALALNWYVAAAYQVSAQVLNPFNTPAYQWYLGMPYTKFAVVIMGVAFGFLFDAKMKKGNQAFPLLKEKNAKGWITATVIWLLAIFILVESILLEYSINHNAASWTTLDSTFFTVFWRPLFCFACALLVLPVFFGFGDFLRLVLGSFPLRVLGRLSYGAYLSFPLAQCFYYSVMPVSLTLFMGKAPMLYIINIFSTYVFAFFVFMLIEEPSRKLLTYSFGKLRWANTKPLKNRDVLYEQHTTDLTAPAAYTVKGK